MSDRKYQSDSNDNEEDSLDRLVKMRQQEGRSRHRPESSEQEANRMDIDEEGSDYDQVNESSSVHEQEQEEEDDLYMTRRRRRRNRRDDLLFQLGQPQPNEDSDRDTEEEEDDEIHRFRHENASGDEDDEEEEEDLRRGRNPRDLFGALAGLMPGFPGMPGMGGLADRSRPILDAIKQRDDPIEVMSGLQELSEMLLISTEDLLIGIFPVEQFSRALVDILTDPLFEDSAEILLLACRTISNLIEAIPSSVASIVHADAVPAVCAKLFEIQYIDLAEQALSTLERISRDYPEPIVRADGLSACLTYLDFFSTHVQRTALSAAANCCRNISPRFFGMVRDIIPTLENVLSNHDQQVAEKACLCVCEIVDSFGHRREQLEQLITGDLLRKLIQLTNPAVSANTSSEIRSRILVVLATLAASSSELASLMVQDRVADIVYQLLTGKEPMFEKNDTVTKDNAGIIQALMHSSKALITTSLKIIINVFPPVPVDEDASYVSPYRLGTSIKPDSDMAKRNDILKKHVSELRHFSRTATSLMLDIYTSSIDIGIRQKILMALFRMVKSLDAESLYSVFENLPVASLLSTIFSQQDMPSLILGGLELSKVLLTKIGTVYRSQLYRLGIMAEVTKIANEDPPAEPHHYSDMEEDHGVEEDESEGSHDSEDDSNEGSDEESEEEESDDEEEEEEENAITSRPPSNPVKIFTFQSDLKPLLIAEAGNLLGMYEAQSEGADQFEDEAVRVMKELQTIADGFTSRNSIQANFSKLKELLPSVSSFELVNSGVLQGLLSLLTEGDDPNVSKLRKRFLRQFINADNSLGQLVEKCQDALSRAEKFEVVTSGVADSRASPANVLARQLRVKLVAEKDTDLPQQYQNFNISIQAIASFKAIEEFVKSRVSWAELLSRNGGSGRRTGGSLSNALFALAAATGMDPETARRRLPGLEDFDDDEEMPDASDDETAEVGALEGAVEHSDEELDLTNEDTPTRANRRGSSHQNREGDHGRVEESSWRLEFYLNGSIIPPKSTVFGTIYRYLELREKEKRARGETPNPFFARDIWTSMFTIKFKKTTGPLAEEEAVLVPEAEDLNPFLSTPVSFGDDKVTAITIRLLSVLFTLNSNYKEILGLGSTTGGPRPVSKSSFLSSKLTAKLNRQLDEPLVVASGTLPSWIVDATRLYPFLFPFDTRFLFLQSTSFGYSRSMQRWVSGTGSDDRIPMGRNVRQKVRVSRNNILHSAVKVMAMCGASPNILEIEFYDEAGTGLGPTLEFYSLVSKDFVKQKYRMWRAGDSTAQSEYIYNKQGLFPAPLNEKQLKSEYGKKILSLFEALGTFVARALLDSRIIDLNLNPVFFRIAGSKVTVDPSISTVRAVDNQLGSSLEMLEKFAIKKAEADGGPIDNIEVDGARLADLDLDFTYPGHPQLELKPSGARTAVTMDNIEEYLHCIVDMTLGGGVARQVAAFKKGFSLVFPYSSLHAFTPEELANLCGQSEEDWSFDLLYDVVKADHGFTKDSPTVLDLLRIMSELSVSVRRQFMQFMTGSPNLPVGGFRALSPVFTIVRKDAEAPLKPDDYLPSVMTCANYLKIPEYSSTKILKERIMTAITEGSGAFLLS
ncbi:ubiquitin fusion degradation protein 4 [Trichomonascus vanleenenianus]|uniref:putative ubiquitin-protein ligase UFD4 n=1 Tax=Trichomonascus vanleenenianus TaxID=2268995 RepID=UPI003ECA0BBC